MKISNLIKDQTEQILIKQPKTKDCDRKLCYAYWYYFVDKAKYTHFKDWWLSDECNYETTSRYRRKLQEEKTELRGEKYMERQKRETEIRNASINNEL